MRPRSTRTTDAPRRILVTGASGRIGHAIALELARAGFHLTLHARSRVEAAQALQAEVMALGVEADVCTFDVRDREGSRAILEGLLETHGAYYGIICNAGITRDGAFPGMEAPDWDAVLSTSLDGFYNIVHPLVMPMIRARRGGRIITIASVSGLVGNRGQVNYSAAKAGLIGATKALAVELAGRHITVNAVAPGLIDTDMIGEVALEHALQAIPMGRVGRPEEVASAVGFLCSDGAAYITRQVLGINGGLV